ncbi:MAG: hypothetical protein QG622_620 [Actinomycetota bacterium]|nr:hypothetical protein [Actinomycetota bacterium]
MIDRRALVSRHDVDLSGIDPTSPLTVGNGEFCVTVDVTGLQSLPAAYPVLDPAGGTPGTLLGTMASWGWHSVPGGDAGLDAFARTYPAPTGPVRYVDLDGDLAAVDAGASADGGIGGGGGGGAAWLRANPHRLDLARIGFAVQPAGPDGEVRPLRPDDVAGPHQHLDLWGGVIDSRFVLRGRPVRVRTVCHPEEDVLGVRVRSPALAEGLVVRVGFPYGSVRWADAADWTRPDAHRTDVEEVADGWLVTRALDGTRYLVRLGARPGTRLRRTGPHELVLRADSGGLALSVAFTPVGRAPGNTKNVTAGPPAGASTIETASRRHWARFWNSGGAVDLSGTADPRAVELERRTVLSQYLTAVNCAGSLPPAETGLTCNSWRGRFHLEMHWWHAAHFATWGRPELLEPSLRWYAEILPVARATARGQGYDGARWPKQVGPDGRESPSPIGPFLIWQQPHPIHLAELVRRAHARAGDDPDGGRAVRRYAPLVLATADFMASFASRTTRGFELGPPLVPAQESYAAERHRLRNPPFELAYWRWGLRVAARWRELLGIAPDPRWDAVADGLVRPPETGGVLAACELGGPGDGHPWTLRADHPSMVYGLGVVPSTGTADPGTVRRTLTGVLGSWDWDSTWGWDYPALAMTAARLGDPATAVDVLSMPTEKNRHVASGHNRQSGSLPVYLPGNGGLLAAVALLAAGWDAAPGPAPGFPASWTVRHEGLIPSP